ncbi:hypothetical protein TSUD_242080 [Trifolium subterraneum]|uniref:Receptor-like serine/threonine-protein kinase n=1 Tax=Trifolium subterraneum TaxID=3900 RepID=A0A2Z6MF49_TRISU|nr:hypothetical protein TSUD_242080 [Trifolium subterraneum]
MIDNITVVVFCLLLLISYMRTSTSLDSLSVNQYIKDGETLVSANGTFEMGFFSPGNSKGRYLGMWYKNLTPFTVLWVANRETPVNNNSGGVLKLNQNGVLVILNGANNTVWSSNISNKGGVTVVNNSTTAQLLDTGNLVLKIGPENILWQSFDYPCDILLPGMKLGWNLLTGSWNGRAFTGYPIQPLKQQQKFEFVMTDKEVYHRYEIIDKSLICVYRLTLSGNLEALVWTNHTNSMDGNIAKCECLKGYVPKNPDQWNISYWSSGCFPKMKSICGNNNTSGFLKYKEMKLPDTSSSWYNKTMNLVECQKLCLKNCSCTAYANTDIRNGGSGCLLWFDDVFDMRLYEQWGQDLYIRVPSEPDHVSVDIPGSKDNWMMHNKAVLIIVGFFTFTCIIIFIRRLASRVYGLLLFPKWQVYSRLRKEDMDLPVFDFSILVKASNNFSSVNKLGEGGFGPVYKGTLVDGKEVAIKRHSKVSDQGLEEFKNEIALIAKLQHRNLVNLLGCCIHKEEMLLLYEYMPNKSLDYFIFDETRSKLLVWTHRSNIIAGIARGLLYLHQDSRLKIIHRDMKTSNILLDAHMNPKISDFGLARTFRGDQVEAKTKKMVGTYGYMPPEYAVHGRYSMKSDVFSFGVIVLEIISGNKIKRFYDPEHSLNLLGHAWRLWIENMPMELLDTDLLDMCISSEVIRCIHVGLLCVQQKPGDRPDMSSVILMLNGEKLLPQPKAPGFYTGNGSTETISPSSNQMSATNFVGR